MFQHFNPSILHTCHHIDFRLLPVNNIIIIVNICWYYSQIEFDGVIRVLRGPTFEHHIAVTVVTDKNVTDYHHFRVNCFTDVHQHFLLYILSSHVYYIYLFLWLILYYLLNIDIKPYTLHYDYHIIIIMFQGHICLREIINQKYRSLHLLKTLKYYLSALNILNIIVYFFSFFFFNRI